MKRIVASIVMVLAVGLGLATDRIQKSSLIVTPEGWRSSSNVSNTTMIMGRNGSKLIGFNLTLCGPNRAGGAPGDKASSAPSPRPVIGFDMIPVVDLNGTVHLLSDDIIPVTTISGDIIFTTPQALSPLNNSTMAAPLDKYRQRSDPQRKADKNMLLDQNKWKSGANPSSISSMGDPSPRSGFSTSMSNTATGTASSSRTLPNASGKSSSNLYPSNKNALFPSTTAASSNQRKNDMSSSNNEASSNQSPKKMDPSSSNNEASSNQSPKKNDMSSSNNEASSYQSSEKNEMSSSSKTFNNLPSSPSSDKSRNHVPQAMDAQDSNDPERKRAGGNLIPSTATRSSEDPDQDAMDQFLNDVLSPILSSTSLWRSGPTSSSDMVLIPVDTGDLFQGDLIIETEDPQDNVFISDPSSSRSLLRSSHDPAAGLGPGSGIWSGQSKDQMDDDTLPIGVASPEQLQMQDPSTSSRSQTANLQKQQSSSRSSSRDQQEEPLPIGVASPEQLQIQDPLLISSSSRSQQTTMQKQRSSSRSSSPDQPQEPLPIGIASPELLQNLDPVSGGISSSPKLSDPKQYATGSAFSDNESQASEWLPVGVASPEQLYKQQEEKKRGSWSRDPMQDGPMKMGFGSADPDKYMMMGDEERDPEEGVILILGPGSGPGQGQRSGPGSGWPSSSPVQMIDADCDPIIMF